MVAASYCAFRSGGAELPLLACLAAGHGTEDLVEGLIGLGAHLVVGAVLDGVRDEDAGGVEPE